jgi:hypothetical protein
MMKSLALPIAAAIWLLIMAVEAAHFHGLSKARITRAPTLPARDAAQTEDLTTITETEFDGATNTMTFSKTVLSDYTDLLEKITVTTVMPTSACENVTLDATATATSCISLNATITNTIWPSGVVLVPEVGAFLPPELPGEPNEDERCPKEKPKCSELSCLGIVLQMCTLPPITGCSCEVDECPKEEVFCSDAECAGQDGK